MTNTLLKVETIIDPLIRKYSLYLRHGGDKVKNYLYFTNTKQIINDYHHYPCNFIFVHFQFPVMEQ